MEMKEECIICKAPLIYLEKDEMMECVLCHKKELSKTRCEQGHYVCCLLYTSRRCKALFQETKNSRTKACKSFIRSLIRRFRIGIVRQPEL